jgi:hypothetical protein
MIFVRTLTLIAIVEVTVSLSYCAEPGARDIVTESIANYEKDWRDALNYTYLEHQVSKDTTGNVKTTEVSEITVIDGTPYSRLIARSGNPLTGEEARKEEQKYRKAVSTRDAESSEQRSKRLRKYETDRRFLHEIPAAFDMLMVGTQSIDGRPNYVIHLTPRPGYVPQLRAARIFPCIEGKLWVDQQDLRWTKAEAEVIDTISIGWVMARIGPGAHINLTQTKVEGGPWMSKEICINGAARILLVMNKDLNETMSYSGYKRAAPHPAAVTGNVH